MNRKLIVLVFTLTFVLGLLICGCAGQPGAAPESGNLPVSNIDVNKPGEVSSPEAKKMPAENSYPPPVGDIPQANPSYPEPGQGYPAPSEDNPGAPPEWDRELPLSMQLALGTLKLEGTDNAVTTEQAANLLLLWKVAYNLSTAEDAKAEDLEAAFEQIQDAMSAEQIEAIQSMEMTRDDITVLAEELGIDLPSNPFPTMSAEQQATMQASGQGMPPAGTPGVGGPGGGYPGSMGSPPPGGGQNPPGGGNPMGRPGGPGGFEEVIYQAVIDLLESKTE